MRCDSSEWMSLRLSRPEGLPEPAQLSTPAVITGAVEEALSLHNGSTVAFSVMSQTKSCLHSEPATSKPLTVQVQLYRHAYGVGSAHTIISQTAEDGMA